MCFLAHFSRASILFCTVTPPPPLPPLRAVQATTSASLSSEQLAALKDKLLPTPEEAKKLLAFTGDPDTLTDVSCMPDARLLSQSVSFLSDGECRWASVAVVD